MKKIILIAILFAGSTIMFAQQNKMIKQNAVSIEDPHNPLVNGIPYNQYKAEVRAENNKRAEAETKAKAELKAETDKMSAVKLPPIDDQQNGQKSSHARTSDAKK